MNPQDLKEYIVQPTLHAINEYIPESLSAERLVLGTAAQESLLYYLDQTPSGPGPAYGIYQMEAETHNGHLAWLKQKGDFWKLVQSYQVEYLDNCLEMVGNLYYATIMCRIHYWRKTENLPSASDIYALGSYWKRHYNTYIGKGTVEEFVKNYNKFIKPLV